MMMMQGLNTRLNINQQLSSSRSVPFDEDENLKFWKLTSIYDIALHCMDE